jgi:hypothetical protein
MSLVPQVAAISGGSMGNAPLKKYWRPTPKKEKLIFPLFPKKLSYWCRHSGCPAQNFTYRPFI